MTEVFYESHVDQIKTSGLPFPVPDGVPSSTPEPLTVTEISRTDLLYDTDSIEDLVPPSSSVIHILLHYVANQKKNS